MYKRTNPQQKLFGVDAQISPKLRNRLEKSWPYLFKTEILPILFKNEDQYAMLYGKTGRPNFSVARLSEEDHYRGQASIDRNGKMVRP